LGALIALSFASMAALLLQFGTTFTMQIVFILWSVLFLASVLVFRRKSDI
jgi:hypothetical protein